MHYLASTIAVALALVVAQSGATTLTYRMAPHERACFYTTASFVNEKMAFYFAVQSGGAFDIDFEVLGPDSSIILAGQKERQGDYVFTATKTGEHTFCFSNIMSTFAEKLIDFDVTAEHETSSYQGSPGSTTSTDPDKAAKAKEEVKPMEDAANKIAMHLSNIMRDQRYFRTRENRDFDTVKSTESRIFWFSITQGAVIVLTAFVQVFIIQTFFSKSSGRGRV